MFDYVPVQLGEAGGDQAADVNLAGSDADGDLSLGQLLEKPHFQNGALSWWESLQE